jgi:hypothetical protein
MLIKQSLNINLSEIERLLDMSKIFHCWGNPLMKGHMLHIANVAGWNVISDNSLLLPGIIQL